MKQASAVSRILSSPTEAFSSVRTVIVVRTITLALGVSLYACGDYDADTPMGDAATFVGAELGGSPPFPDWPQGPPDTCVVDSAVGSPCICGGVEYDSGYCCATGFSWSSCPATALYVTPTGSGAQTGADWNNALAGLPTTLTRDRIYWISDGIYETGARTFNDPPSGSLGITIRKATDAMHGTAVGWVSTLGDGVAEFEATEFAGDRYTIDGGGLGGIRFTTVRLANDDLLTINGNYVVVRNVEADGGTVVSGTTQTAGMCSSVKVQGDHAVLDRIDAHNAADDGIEVNQVDSLTIVHSKIYNTRVCGTDSATVLCDGPCHNGHSDGIELLSSTNVTIRGNVVYDIKSTSALFTDDPTVANSGLVVEGNIFYTPRTGLTVLLDETPGARIFNNVIWGRTQGSRYGGIAFDGPNESPGLQFKNNIVTSINFSHLNGGVPDYSATAHDLDYNVIGTLDTNEYPGSPHDIVADPRFVGIPLSADEAAHSAADLVMSEFALQADSPAIDSGAVVGPAWAIDGVARPQGAAYDVGAYEASGAGGAGGAGGTGGTNGDLCAGKVPEYQASNNAWQSSEQQAEAFSQLTFTAYARTDGLDALVWISDAPITTFSDAAMLVRFNPSGNIDARDGGAYVAKNVIPYSFGTWYKLTVDANLGTQTYTVDVGECDGPQQRVVTNAAFRTPITAADYFGLWAFSGVTVDLEGATWSADPCAPTTCVAEGYACGTPSDGCGGTLSCGTCAPEEICLADYTCGVGVAKPTPDNTGPVGPLTPYTGPRTIRQDGAVYENFEWIGGSITIEADNVTIRNCLIDAQDGGSYGLQIHRSNGTVIEDCEFVRQTSAAIYDTAGTTRITRAHIHEQRSDGLKLSGRETIVEHSLITKIGRNLGTGHHDGIQARNCRDCVIRSNTIGPPHCEGPPYNWSVGILYENATTPLLVEGNWLDGNWAVNGSDHAPTRLKDNKFGTYFNQTIWGGGIIENLGGNVWECDGTPVTGGKPPKPACAVTYPGPPCQ